MSVKYPTYRDIYIDKGTDFVEIIELSGPYTDFTFSGNVRNSYTSSTSVPIEFASVNNEPNKATISISAANTALLKRFRGVYDIFATSIATGDVHKERAGTAFYNESASTESPGLPDPENSYNEYIDHAAADADPTLLSGGVYKLTDDRALYQKP